MSRNEIKSRVCPICGNTFEGKYAYCTLECLHASNKSYGSYDEKRKILDYMLEHPNESSRSIAKLFGVSKSVTERLSVYTERKKELIEVDENYFNIINTEDKAYWLGFLYADGYIKKRKSNSYTVELCLAEIDLEHLKKFKKTLKSNCTIRRKIVKLNNKEFVAYRLCISREKMYNDLINKGCIENKSLVLTFPNSDIFEDKNLVKHFIRGYVDGDGCIGIYGKNNTPHLSMLGTYDFLNGVLMWLKEHGKLDTSANVTRCTGKGKEKIFQLSLSNRKAMSALFHLYENSNIYLERKYNKYLKIKDIYKDVL